MHASVEKTLLRLEELGGISDSGSYLVRTFLSPANQIAGGRISEWMESLGMHTTRTPDGTVRGIFPGSNPGSAPLLLGSHYDTVIDAGKYDGPLGILSALAALEILQAEGTILPFPVHVLAFSDEEGTRFQTTYLGSRGITGGLDNETLSATDSNGISVRQSIETTDQDGTKTITYQTGECSGYLELHIEQGRVLEEAGLPTCVVTSIAGQSRLKVELTGRTDHAGTTPMPLRRDALTGAAECILASEVLASANPPLVITVGKLSVHPDVSNSVPQNSAFTIDLRHPDDRQRTLFLENLRLQFIEISNKRRLKINWQMVQENDAVPCDPHLTKKLLDSMKSVTGAGFSLTSGAGHDGVNLSKICPIAMLFIRCRDGLSHHPDEYAAPEDIGTAIEILTHFLKSYPS